MLLLQDRRFEFESPKFAARREERRAHAEALAEGSEEGLRAWLWDSGVPDAVARHVPVAEKCCVGDAVRRGVAEVVEEAEARDGVRVDTVGAAVAVGVALGDRDAVRGRVAERVALCDGVGARDRLRVGVGVGDGVRLVWVCVGGTERLAVRVRLRVWGAEGEGVAVREALRVGDGLPSEQVRVGTAVMVRVGVKEMEGPGSEEAWEAGEGRCRGSEGGEGGGGGGRGASGRGRRRTEGAVWRTAVERQFGMKPR